MGILDVDALSLGVSTRIELPEHLLECDVARGGVDNVAATMHQ